MYTKILEQWTRDTVEPYLSDTQIGFRKGREFMDAIFALWQLSEKASEYNKDLHIVFIDQDKAFDRVNRAMLWIILDNYNININVRAL